MLKSMHTKKMLNKDLKPSILEAVFYLTNNWLNWILRDNKLHENLLKNGFLSL
jgi:hypothetical protein